MVRSIATVVCLLILSAPAAAADVDVGDTVLAYWAPARAYFVGTVVEKRATGYYVVFEDGDNAIVPKTKVLKNNIKVGSSVFAKWKNGKYYKGKVAKIVGRALYIHYDDGDKGWAPWSWIAIK